MARNMLFNVKNHPTKDIPGVTTVSDEHIMEDGTTPVIEMGELTKKRGEDGYRAAYLDGKTLTAIRGIFSTRSQAGHAVRAKFETELRSDKAKDRKTVKTTKTSKTSAVSDDQKAKDKRNARRRELRAAKKA